MKNNTAPNMQFDLNAKCCSNPAQDEFYPSLLSLQPNVVNRGRIFSVELISRGLGVQEKKVTVDKEAWSECSRSPHFDTCLKLSMAKLALEAAI